MVLLNLQRDAFILAISLTRRLKVNPHLRVNLIRIDLIIEYY
jgi:hypothetical protein